MAAIGRSKPLHGQTVLITGAARRLGRIWSIEAAKLGADLIMHYNSSGREAEELCGLIKENYSVKCHLWQQDLAIINQLKQSLGQLLKKVPLHILVNNAAVFFSDAQIESKPELERVTFDINFVAPHILSEVVAETSNVKSGKIINIVDWRAVKTDQTYSLYSHSKRLLYETTKTHALKYSPRFSVNALALGAILPPAGKKKEEAAINQVPLKRWIKNEEFENAIQFLLTCNEYLTGEIIFLDGGRHLA